MGFRWGRYPPNLLPSPPHPCHNARLVLFQFPKSWKISTNIENGAVEISRMSSVTTMTSSWTFFKISDCALRLLMTLDVRPYFPRYVSCFRSLGVGQVGQGWGNRYPVKLQLPKKKLDLYTFREGFWEVWGGCFEYVWRNSGQLFGTCLIHFSVDFGMLWGRFNGKLLEVKKTIRTYIRPIKPYLKTYNNPSLLVFEGELYLISARTPVAFHRNFCTGGWCRHARSEDAIQSLRIPWLFIGFLSVC